MTSPALSAGDYAINLSTGEARLVVEYSLARDEVTFAGSQRWESAKHWVSNVRATPMRSAPR